MTWRHCSLCEVRWTHQLNGLCRVCEAAAERIEAAKFRCALCKQRHGFGECTVRTSVTIYGVAS